MIVAVFVADGLRRDIRLSVPVHAQERQGNARETRLAVILQAVSVLIQPDRVADLSRFNRAEVEAVDFLPALQRHRRGRRRAALHGHNARAARLAALVGEQFAAGQGEAQRIASASNQPEAVSAVLADGLLRRNAAVFIQQRHRHAGERRFLRVHHAVRVLILPRAAADRRGFHRRDRFKRQAFAHREVDFARLPFLRVRMRQFQRRAALKEPVLRQRHAHPVLTRPERRQLEIAVCVRLRRRDHRAALRQGNHRVRRGHTSGDSRRRNRADVHVLAAFAHRHGERRALRAVCVRLRDGALAAAGEHHSIRQRHAERVIARAHKVQRIPAVFVRLRALQGFSVRRVKQLDPRAGYARFLFAVYAVVSAVLPDRAGHRADRHHADVQIQIVFAAEDVHAVRLPVYAVRHRHDADAPRPARVLRKRIAVRKGERQLRPSGHHAVKAVAARSVRRHVQGRARVRAVRDAHLHRHALHARVAVLPAAVVVRVHPDHAADGGGLQCADVHARERFAHVQFAQTDCDRRFVRPQGERIRAAHGIDIALRQRHAHAVRAGHQPVERKFAGSGRLGLRHLLAVAAEQRDRRAAQTLRRFAHQAVIIAVQPYAARDFALRQQTEGNALDLRAAEHRERGGIPAPVPRAFQRENAVLRRAGKDVALRRVHAEFIAAGRDARKREPSVFVGCRAFRDEAPCAVHQVHLDAGEQLFLRLPHAVAVSVDPNGAGQRPSAHNARVHLAERVAAGERQHARGGNRIVALLHAALGHAAFRRGEAAVRLLRRKPHAIAPRRNALKGIASVLGGARGGHRIARRVQQLHLHIPAIQLACAELRIRVVVIIDSAGNRAGEHRADVQLHAGLPHRQGERFASAAG